jgi:hypothetical protein
MSSYLYPPLPSEGDNIRLLCLLPHEYEAAPLQCALRNYSLPKLDTRTHLYEALSYVWGNPDETLPSLRDRSFERIILVDAVCIYVDRY